MLQDPVCRHFVDWKGSQNLLAIAIQGFVYIQNVLEKNSDAANIEIKGLTTSIKLDQTAQALIAGVNDGFCRIFDTRT